MTPGRIVEPLDVVEHICSGLVPGAVGFALDALGLQRREEAFHRRIVPNIAGSAHAANNAAGATAPARDPQTGHLPQKNRKDNPMSDENRLDQAAAKAVRAQELLDNE